MEEESVRILVVGNGGVGKTALLHRLCTGEFSENVGWTTGCDTHVLRYESSMQHSPVYLEFIDVGGHDTYKITRSLFYNDMQLQ